MAGQLLQFNVNGPGAAAGAGPNGSLTPIQPLQGQAPSAAQTFASFGNAGIQIGAILVLWVILEIMASEENLEPLAIGLAGVVALALTLNTSQVSAISALRKLGF